MSGGGSHALEPTGGDDDGETLLHAASYYGNTDIVELLLTANADPNATDKAGATPLHTACRRHQCRVARALLDGGANVHANDNDGLEPLRTFIAQTSSQPNTSSLQTLQVLVAFGATWDEKCDELVATGTANTDAPTLRVCVLEWMQEHADGLSLTNIPIEVVRRGPKCVQIYLEDVKRSR